MKISVDELRERAQQASETEQAVQEGLGTPQPQEAPQGPQMGPQHGHESAIDELRRSLQAERELREFLAEERGPTLSEGIAEFLKDPQARNMLKELWYGPGGPSQNQPNQPVQQPQPPQNQEVMESPQPAADGGQTAEINADVMYAVLVEILENVSAMQPDMTAQEMVDYAVEYESQIKAELEGTIQELNA